MAYRIGQKPGANRSWRFALLGNPLIAENLDNLPDVLKHLPSQTSALCLLDGGCTMGRKIRPMKRPLVLAAFSIMLFGYTYYTETYAQCTIKSNSYYLRLAWGR
jgi:hypothetical protein